jgi:Glycosyl transferase family 2
MMFQKKLESPSENTPQISVIMSVFNGQEFLEQAARSILNQTMPNFEFIVIDDGSTDNSLKILKDLANADSRLVILSRENKGLIFSLNEAASNAKAPLLARMDCDDVAHPTRFEKQLNEFAMRPNLVALGCQVNFIDRHGSEFGKEIVYPIGDNEIQINRSLGGPFLAHPTLMMRASAFRSVGEYRAPFVAAEDLDLIYRLFEVGELDNLPERLLDYRFHGNNVSIVGGLRQMLTRATLLELLEQKEKSGVDYLSLLTTPISLATIESQTNLPGIRSRLLNRLVTQSFAYNHHVMGSAEGLSVFSEHIQHLKLIATRESLSTRRKLIWTGFKSLVRSKQFRRIVPMLRSLNRTAKL